MLLTEWNMEDALAVRYEEGWDDGLEKGRSEVARNALIKGISINTISEITGLGIEDLKRLAAAGK